VFFPLVVLQTIVSLAVTYLVSAYNVALRDLQHIVANVVQMLFFLSPIVWSVDRLPAEYQGPVLYLNPMAAFVNAYRDVFYAHQLPALAPLVGVTASSLFVLWLSSGVFERRREEFAELV
jgi:ABC-type polysaccharide/polyol phosphate export permease